MTTAAPKTSISDAKIQKRNGDMARVQVSGFRKNDANLLLTLKPEL
jgi:hypothetical protein